MVSASFIFRPGEYDAEFFELDKTIEESNSGNPEFLGKDTWANEEKELQCVVYYYKSMKGVSDLRNIQAHKTAKAQYSRWYKGYQVIISEIARSYGDGSIEHPTPAMDF